MLYGADKYTKLGNVLDDVYPIPQSCARHSQQSFQTYHEQWRRSSNGPEHAITMN